MPERKTPDRRKRPRVDLLLKVEYQDHRDLLDDYILNMPQGGVFIHTQVPFETGARISFVLSFPGPLEPMQLDGVLLTRQHQPVVQHRVPGQPLRLLGQDVEAAERLQVTPPPWMGLFRC